MPSFENVVFFFKYIYRVSALVLCVYVCAQNLMCQCNVCKRRRRRKKKKKKRKKDVGDKKKKKKKKRKREMRECNWSGEEPIG